MNRSLRLLAAGGTASTGSTGTLWFSAGPNDEADGLVGQLIPSAG